MIRSLDSLAIWLGDFYLLSTVLLTITLATSVALRQPAQRSSVIKATLVALGILAVLCALPRWSVVHLRSTEQSGVTSSATPKAAFAAASAPNGDTKRPTNNDAAPLPLAKPSSDAETASAVLKEIGWQRGLVVAYIAGAAGVFVWLIIGQLAAVRLRRLSHPAPAELVAMLKEVATRSRVSPIEESLRRELETASRRDAATWSSLSETRNDGFGDTSLLGLELRLSARIAAPVALGLFHPVILVPKDFAEAQPEICNPNSAVPSILAHELAHIRNHDLAWLAVSRVLLVLLWAQPLYWLVRRRLRFDQETLADAAAAELTSRQQYAEQLVAWARSLSTRPLPMRLSPAVGLWEGASQLRQRVGLLVNANFTILRTCSRRWCISASVAAIALGLSLSTATVQPANHAIAQPAPITKNAATQPFTTPTVAKETLARERRVPNTIIGVAVDEKDAAIADAEVFLFRVDTRDSSRTLIRQTTTNTKGEFRFSDVINIEKEFPNKKFPPLNPPGTSALHVVVRKPGSASFRWIAGPGYVAEHGMNQRFTMAVAAALNGRITGPDGEPVTGAQLSIGGYGEASDWEGINFARTDADGNYKIEDLQPFSLAEYRQNANQKREQPGKTNTLFTSPDVLTIKASGFATKKTYFEQVPGKQDVQLERPAILNGRVVFADSGKPASNVLVEARVIITSHASPVDLDRAESPIYPGATVRTDQDGVYYIRTLPPGSYSLMADVHNWVTTGVSAYDATSERPTQLPDLILTKGGILSARMVDANTGKPIPMESDLYAMLVSQPQTGPPTTNFSIAVSSQGRFNMRVPAGKESIVAGSVHRRNGEFLWFGRQNKRTEVDVVEGQTIEIDVAVDKFEPDAAAGASPPPASDQRNK